MSEKKKGKIPACSLLPRSEKQINHSLYGNIGRKRGDDAIQKCSDTKLNNFIDKHGAVLQYDLNWNLIKEWDTIPVNIASEINIDYSHLLKSIKNNKMCKGSYWKYKK